MAVALKRHELVYIHRSKLGNTTNIVARQIHQHHMLGNLFWIFLQLGCQFAIVLLVDTTFASARNWSTHHFAIAQLHQRLGRATNNGQFGMLDVIHIRTWVDLTQHAVHVKRIGIQSNIKSLREHDLKNIASLDVLFCGQHCTLIRVAVFCWIKTRFIIFRQWRFNRHIRQRLC